MGHVCNHIHILHRNLFSAPQCVHAHSKASEQWCCLKLACTILETLKALSRTHFSITCFRSKKNQIFWKENSTSSDHRPFSTTLLSIEEVVMVKARLYTPNCLRVLNLVEKYHFSTGIIYNIMRSKLLTSNKLLPCEASSFLSTISQTSRIHLVSFLQYKSAKERKVSKRWRYENKLCSNMFYRRFYALKKDLCTFAVVANSSLLGWCLLQSTFAFLDIPSCCWSLLYPSNPNIFPEVFCKVLDFKLFSNGSLPVWFLHNRSFNRRRYIRWIVNLNYFPLRKCYVLFQIIL